jgi:ankyrin repeat protein
MNENIMNKIIFYVKDNCFVKFKELFERTKVDIEYKDTDGNTLLNHSSQADSYEISEYLMNYGADLNTQNVKFYFYYFF